MVSGNSVALESLEVGFQQDLNGDKFLGLVTTVIASHGSVSLTEVGNQFYLNNGTGVTLKYAGADIVASQLGAWTPVDVKQTAAGYEVTWKAPGADQSIVWNTDSNGNYTSTLIASNGSASLTEVGNQFYLNYNGAGTTLKSGGADVLASQLGAWTPIGVEKTAAGYEVAWKVAGADQYTVWTIGSDGNYSSDPIGVVSGNSAALVSLEPSFYEDLNGDGVIGTYSTVIRATGNVVLNLKSLSQAATIDAGATLEISGVDSGDVTFSGSTGTLVLDDSMHFAGTISGLTGDGTLTNSDVLDLRDVAFSAGLTASYSHANGTLTVGAANVHLSGDYTNSTFNLSDDGHGGTLVVDPPVNPTFSREQLSPGNANSAAQIIVGASQKAESGDVVRFMPAVEAGGQDAVGLRLNLVPASNVQTVIVPYGVSLAEAHLNVRSDTAAQPTLVTVEGSGNQAVAFIQAPSNETNGQLSLLAGHGTHDMVNHVANEDSQTVANVPGTDTYAGGLMAYPNMEAVPDFESFAALDDAVSDGEAVRASTVGRESVSPDDLIRAINDGNIAIKFGDAAAGPTSAERRIWLFDDAGGVFVAPNPEPLTIVIDHADVPVSGTQADHGSELVATAAMVSAGPSWLRKLRLFGRKPAQQEARWME